MIAWLLALAVQTATEAAKPVPALTALDPCVELQGGGRATIGAERMSGRALAKAVAARVPAGRPLFIRFANERAKNDIEGMSTVMAGAANAPEIVIVKTCVVPGGDIAQ